ncbi:MAG TPA: sodium:solute symporter family protein [Spirochaetales bacterium]|nr:sodium:solute symporter family protein [Spirochaetales bacterium]HPD80223.1 sodium:solute symporter family protein [Spirochaetales bacterium]HQK34813.1 sodium:solute symporter family protein [Spirochaetales bacterium]HRV28256.1 sodium:solute symporter family protein [Spirochaetia bacterium]
MPITAVFIFVFLVANLVLAFVKQKEHNPNSFVLAERSLSGFSLFLTLLASNLSAFTIFGVSGAGYRIGWAFFPVMAFGTGFMALSFILFGLPLRKLSLESEWVTPAQCIEARFQSKVLGKVYAIILLVFTLPYLSVQIGAAGSMIASVSNLPTWICSLIVTVIIAFYIVRGGMRSVVRTDILQAFALYFFAGLAFLIVMLFFSKNQADTVDKVLASGIADRNGINNTMPLISLVSYYALWFLADPMFPHLTQRFFAAKSDRAILTSMALYPFASLIIFFMMTGLGVAGAVLIPGLTGSQSDTVFTKLSILITGNWAPVFSIAALAALMSTMDSQLLSCASICVEDFLPGKRKSVSTIKLVTMLFALLSWIISLKPPASLLSFLTGTAFAGYAILAPIMFTAIYIPYTGKLTALISLIAGAALVFIQALKLWTPPLPAVFFNVAIQSFILCIGFIVSHVTSKVNNATKVNTTTVTPYKNEYITPLSVFVALILLFLAIDFWNYGKTPVLFLGIPTWVWYHAFITVLLGIACLIFRKKHT